MKISEIARVFDCKFYGADADINRGAALEKARKGDIAYLENVKKAGLLKNCAASCIILPRNLPEENLPEKSAVILTSNPKLLFARCMKLLEEKKEVKSGIDSSAKISKNAEIDKTACVGPFCVIEENAKVGKNSVVGAGSYIGKNSKIGDNCRIYPNVVILENCVIENNVIVHSAAVIGSDGFGYVRSEKGHEKIPQIGKVIIKENAEIGAGCAIDRGALDETVIGKGSKIDNNVHIAHNVKIGKNCLVLAQAGIAGSVTVKDNAIIGGQAGLADHITIGENAVIMSKTGVMFDIKDNAVVFGHFAKPRRDALKHEVLISKLPEMYKILTKIKKRLGV